MKANSTGGAAVSQPVCFYDIITVPNQMTRFHISPGYSRTLVSTITLTPPSTPELEMRQSK